jgi:hypothetical protein
MAPPIRLREGAMENPLGVGCLKRRVVLQLLCGAAWPFAASRAIAAERALATERLDDQKSLAKIAAESTDEKARCDAAGRIQDLALLENAVRHAPHTEHDHIGVIVALRKILYETGLSDRLGPARLSIAWTTVSKDQNWTKYGAIVSKASIDFERVAITIFRGSKVIAQASWGLDDAGGSWSSPIHVGIIPAPIVFVDLLPHIWNACEGRRGTLKPPSFSGVDSANLAAIR